MKLTWCRCFLMALCGQSVLAAERTALVVLHDGSNVVSAKPYYRELEIKRGNMDAAMHRARKQLDTLATPTLPVSLATYFPIRTEHLSVAEPRQKIINQLPIPLFIIGMDARSLDWLSQNFDELKSIGARGVVVQAESFEQFDQLQRSVIAKGLLISATPGDPIANIYGIRTYPMLLKGR